MFRPSGGDRLSHLCEGRRTTRAFSVRDVTGVSDSKNPSCKSASAARARKRIAVCERVLGHENKAPGRPQRFSCRVEGLVTLVTSKRHPQPLWSGTSRRDNRHRAASGDVSTPFDPARHKSLRPSSPPPTLRRAGRTWRNTRSGRRHAGRRRIASRGRTGTPGFRLSAAGRRSPRARRRSATRRPGATWILQLQPEPLGHGQSSRPAQLQERLPAASGSEQTQ